MDANKVEKLLNKRRDIELQIDRIQSKCNHKTKVIKMIHIGSLHEVRWVCEDCSLKLGWPTDFELNKFLDKKA